MLRNHRQGFWILSRILIFYLFLNPYKVEATQKPIEISKAADVAVSTSHEPDVSLRDRVKELESHSQHQRKEMRAMKTFMEEDKVLIHELRGRVDSLETANLACSLKKEESSRQRVKRPYRLIPPFRTTAKTKQIINKIVTVEENITGFYGPPTNCKELGRIGYTLNGYYLVRSDKNQPQAKSGGKIEVVFCRFQYPPGGEEDENVEERLGFVNMTINMLTQMPTLSSSILSTPSSIRMSPVRKFMSEINLATFSRSISSTPSSVKKSSERKFMSEIDPDELNWTSFWTSAGRYVYADDCDFYGYDIAGGIVRSASLKMCIEQCLGNTKCTHATYNSGRCYTKQIVNRNPLSVRPVYWPNAVCGYFYSNRN